MSFSGHAINHDGLYIVPNALTDERFHDNPLVTDAPNIRFYAEYPFELRQGINIGTLCLIDSKPREMDEEDQQLLRDLGEMIEQEIKSLQLATLDPLTLISNRRGFLTLVDHRFLRVRAADLLHPVTQKSAGQSPRATASSHRLHGSPHGAGLPLRRRLRWELTNIGSSHAHVHLFDPVFPVPEQPG